MQPFSRQHTLSMDDISPLPSVEELLRGLTRSPRRIPTALLYDSRGCDLFEQITRTDEYYLTRLELRLLKEAGPALALHLEGADIVELGSGSCEKSALLLNFISSKGLTSTRYMPVDISEESIESSAKALVALYPTLNIKGIVADFEAAMRLATSHRRRIFLFLGSTIGNFSPEERGLFLSSLGDRMHPRDGLLLGIDLRKQKHIVEKAYNDDSGVTAAFNRNILNTVNCLAGTDFEEKLFGHLAFYNAKEGRIEMQLEALEDMRVNSSVMDWSLRLRRGDRLLTEYSHKFRLDQLLEELRNAGLQVDALWRDNRNWYALLFLKTSRKR